MYIMDPNDLVYGIIKDERKKEFGKKQPRKLLGDLLQQLWLMR